MFSLIYFSETFHLFIKAAQCYYDNVGDYMIIYNYTVTTYAMPHFNHMIFLENFHYNCKFYKDEGGRKLLIVYGAFEIALNVLMSQWLQIPPGKEI